MKHLESCISRHNFLVSMIWGIPFMHGEKYYSPLHHDNWGLILVLIDINRAYIILFFPLIAINLFIIKIYYQDMTCIHDTIFNFSRNKYSY